MCNQKLYICAPKFDGCGRIAGERDWNWRSTGSMFWEDDDGDEEYERICPKCGSGEESIKLMNPDPVRDFGLGQSRMNDDDDESFFASLA